MANEVVFFFAQFPKENHVALMWRSNLSLFFPLVKNRKKQQVS